MGLEVDQCARRCRPGGRASHLQRQGIGGVDPRAATVGEVVGSSASPGVAGEWPRDLMRLAKLIPGVTTVSAPILVTRQPRRPRDKRGGRSRHPE